MCEEGEVLMIDGGWFQLLAVSQNFNPKET